MHNIVNPEEFRKNISTKLQNILGDKTVGINLEKGIFNYALKEGTSKKIIKKWDNQSFVMLYLDRLRSIYINLQNSELNEKTMELNEKTEDLEIKEDFSEDKCILVNSKDDTTEKQLIINSWDKKG